RARLAVFRLWLRRPPSPLPPPLPSTPSPLAPPPPPLLTPGGAAPLQLTQEGGAAVPQPEQDRDRTGHLLRRQRAQQPQDAGGQRHRTAADQPFRMTDVDQPDDGARSEPAVDRLAARQRQGATGAQADLRLGVDVPRPLGVGDAADPAPRRLEPGTGAADDRADAGPRIEATGDDIALLGRADHALHAAAGGPRGRAELRAHA